MRLYDYFRSSASYRVRIGLNLKGLAYQSVPVDLRLGAHRSPEYARINAAKAVPALVDGTEVIPQSLAILEYLEETHPQPPLLPRAPAERARVRALALLVACEIHPLNNLRVLNYLTGVIGASDEAKLAWYRHWVKEGFDALEMFLQAPQTGTYCHGDAPTLADVCLVPQVFNALRFDVDLAPYPTIRRIADACEKLPAFAQAHPARQPGAT